MDSKLVLPVIVSIILLSGTITPGYADNVNPVSAFPIIVDGAFSPFDEEWSDITPEAFISPDTDEGTLFQTTLDDPDANAFTYAALAPTAAEGPVDEIYLMYDYLQRTLPFDDPIIPGEFIADIDFPITVVLPVDDGGFGVAAIPESLRAYAGIEEETEEVEVFITVQFRVISVGEPLCPDETGEYDVFIADGGEFLNPDLTNCASEFGIEGAVGFGPSPLGNIRGAPDHLLIELEAALLISPAFADPGSPIEGGVPGASCGDEGVTCGYSPAPAFWGAAVANDLVDPPASEAIFTINSDGSTTVDNIAPFPPNGPGPSAVGGELIPLDTTMILAAGAQYTAAWMIPVIVSGIGFAIVIARKF